MAMEKKNNGQRTRKRTLVNAGLNTEITWRTAEEWLPNTWLHPQMVHSPPFEDLLPRRVFALGLPTGLVFIQMQRIENKASRSLQQSITAKEMPGKWQCPFKRLGWPPYFYLCELTVVISHWNSISYAMTTTNPRPPVIIYNCYSTLCNTTTPHCVVHPTVFCEFKFHQDTHPLKGHWIFEFRVSLVIHPVICCRKESPSKQNYPSSNNEHA